MVKCLVWTKPKQFSSTLHLQSDYCTRAAVEEVERGMEYRRECSIGDFEAMIEAKGKEVDRVRREIWTDRYTGAPPWD